MTDEVIKMKKTLYFILCPILLLLSSCLRDHLPPCPPLQVDISVKDKNYFNVNDVNPEDYRSEEMPFREYVPTLCYLLREAETGKIMEQQKVFPVEGDEKTVSLTFCDCLPFGKYILTVWGGLHDNSVLDMESLQVELHAGNEQGADSYLVNDTLLYDASHYAYPVEMERIKGKLIIQVENLPVEINYSEKKIDGLYHYIDPGFRYSGTTSVLTQTSLIQSEGVETNTMLAPSLEEETAVIGVNLYNRLTRDIPVLTPAAINTTIKRNELTVLKYVYDNQTQDFTIYIRLNDSWNMIYDMGIN